MLRALFLVPLSFMVLWAVLALAIDGPVIVAEQVLPAIYVLLLVAVAIWVRPFSRACLAVLASVVVVLGWWLLLSPENDRAWQADVARVPDATLNGSMLTVRNVRSFGYPATSEKNEADAAGLVEERWVTRTYDLDELVGLDVFVSYWGPTAYGHTMASWEFADGRNLLVSIETRKEVGEEYSALGGFFRRFELYYVVADESDAVAVRAAQRGERVELYRLATPEQGDRKMLLEYVADINALAAEPRWDHALNHNCTTTMWRHARTAGSRFPLDWRLLANGYLLELAHELGVVNNRLSLEALQKLSDITERVRDAAASGLRGGDFARAVRVGLPERAVEREGTR